MKTIKGLILLSTMLTIHLISKAQNIEIETSGNEVKISNPDTIPESNLEKDAIQVIVKTDTIIKVDSSGKMQIDTTVINIGKVQIILRTSEEGNSEIEINEDGDTQIISIPGEDPDNASDYDFDCKHDGSSYNDENCKHHGLKNFKSRIGLLDLGVNTLLYNSTFQMPTEYKGLDMNPGKSINVKLHLFRQRVNLIAHHLNLMYGLTLDMHNYRFADAYNLESRMDSVTLKVLDNSIRKSKLSDAWIELPVMLNIETNPWDTDKSFRINAGAYAGYLLGAHSKVKLADKIKIKEKDDFNMQKFRYGLIGQIGYGWFNVFADYSLTSFFNPEEGPVVTPITFGISVVGF